MTNGEKFKEVFGISQVDEGVLYAFAWLPNHNAAEFCIDWWNAEYKEPKTGYWVHGEYCSECGCDVPAYIIDWKWQKDMNAKYCPNCGARMVEPQESEVKK